MFKRYYEDELEYLREMGAEFAASYPDIAGELGILGRDPDVERLLQGFAFLTARIREQIDSQYPELLHPLMNMVWPFAVRPTPAIGIVEFKPRPGVLQESFNLKRGATLRSIPIEGTACQFQTCRDLTIFPFTIQEILTESPSTTVTQLKVRLDPIPGAALSRIGKLPLSLFCHGSVRQAFGLYHWLLADLLAVRVREIDAVSKKILKEQALPITCINPDRSGHEGLLPNAPSSFRGFHHLHEYFLMPSAQLFLEFSGTDVISGFSNRHGIEICFDLKTPAGETLVITSDNLKLHCVPIVNLFPHPAKTVRVDGTRSDYLLRPESKQLDHVDLFSVEQVSGYSRAQGRELKFLPFYGSTAPFVGTSAYRYQLRLQPAVRAIRSKQDADVNSSWQGVETYISFLNGDGAPLTQDMTISVDLLATNRDLVRRLKAGDVSVPTTDTPSVASFSNIGPFSIATPAPISQHGLWRYLAMMSPNWHLLDSRDALRSTLTLFNIPSVFDRRSRQSLELLLEAIDSVNSVPERRVLGRPAALVNGTSVTVRIHEERFAHPGELYVFGNALSRHLSATSTINTYSRLTILGIDRGLEHTWEPQIGNQALV